MEIDSGHKNQFQKSGIRGLPGKIKENVLNLAKNVKKVGEDDPRRIFHAAKVGLALTVVSLLYYFRPLYDGFGQSGMWAILTVVVVFEFTVGGTVSKCLNRGFATFIAGALGIGAEHLASLCGKTGDPIVLGVLVFLLAAVSTFVRFFPLIKRRYDYGVLIFILTFSLVTVSGYRVDEIFELAHQRLSTILIGAGTCMIISISIRPVWAGEDLHNLIITNIDKLAVFLEGFGGENSEVKANMQGYKSVLNSKATEESLANFARWEPRFGRLRFCQPWKQYLRIGVLTRECACQIEALATHKYSHPKTYNGLEGKIIKSCTIMSAEIGKALREIASSIRETRHSSSIVETNLQHSKSTMNDLTNLLQNLSLNQIGGERGTLGEIVQAVAVASVLVEIISITEKVSESVNDLAKRARFKPLPPLVGAQQLERNQIFLHRGLVKPVDDRDVHVIIPIDGTVGTRREDSLLENHEASFLNKPVLSVTVN